MKYLNKILLFSLLVFAFACDKDGDDDDGMGGGDPMMTAEEIAEEALSADAGWTITGITTNYEDIISEVQDNIDNSALLAGRLGINRTELETTLDCETDDVVKFVTGGTFNYSDETKLCDANSGISITQDKLLFENTTWELKDAETITFTTVADGETSIVDYVIESLTDSAFILSSSVDGNVAADVDVSVYDFTNNLDTRITMTKAN